MVRVFLGIWLAVTGAVVLGGPPSVESSLTEQYYQGLRRRGLLNLAEGALLRGLADPEVSLEERETLTAELARTFAKHALLAQGAEQDDLWRRAETLLHEFLQQHPTIRRSDSFKLLQGQLLFQRARAARWHAKLRPDMPSAVQAAKERVAEAIEHLSALEPVLLQHLEIRRQTPELAGDLPSEGVLHTLLRRARHLLGKAELERARLAAPEARKSMLPAAEGWFEKALEMGGTPDEIWPAQVGLAEVARLAGDGETARARLAEVDTAAAGNAARDGVARVMAELLIDEGTPDRAVTFLIDYRQRRGSLTGPLRMLQIKGLAESAALLEAKSEPEAAQTLRDKVETVVKWTTAEHGGYWAYRARLAARNIDRIARMGPELLGELRQAQLERDRGHPEAAAVHFGKAAELAASPEQAAGYLLAQGRLLMRAKQFQRAADVLAGIPGSAPDFEKPAEAHFLSAYALGAWHDAAPSEARREAYMKRLVEHRARFPKAPTAARAALLLAGVYEQRRQYTEAITPLREIVDDPRYGDAAAAAIARNYDLLLNYLAAAEENAESPEVAAIRRRQQEEWEAKAREELLELTESLRLGKEAAALSMFQAELVLRTVEILSENQAGGDAADVLIDRLLEEIERSHQAEQKAFWEAIAASVRPLAVLSLARRGESVAARAQLDAMGTAPTGDLLRVYQGLLKGQAKLAAKRGAAPDEVGINRPSRASDRFLSAAVLAMLNERRDLLSPEERDDFELALARAEVAGGNLPTAKKRLAQLLEKHPQSRTLLRQAARILTAEEEDPASLRAARDYWRRLARQLPGGSAGWFQARLRVIEASIELGELEEARKLLIVTKLVHPELGGGELRERFADVEERLKVE